MEGFDIMPEIHREEPHSIVYRGLFRYLNNFVLIKKFPYNHAFPDGVPCSLSRELLLYQKLPPSDYVITRFGVVSPVEDGHRVHYLIYEPFFYDLAFIAVRPLPHTVFKKLLVQLLRCVNHCHSNGVIHRNLNPRTLLLDTTQKILKIGDAIGHSFTFVGETEHPGTVTLAYQAPEVLLGATDYSTPVDMWAVGCIFAEMLTGNVLFVRFGDDPEEANKQQLYEIFRQLGKPTLDQWPGLADLPAWKSYQEWEGGPKMKARFYEGGLPQDLATVGLVEAGADLLSKMLSFDPHQRITAEAALKHPYLWKYSGCQRNDGRLVIN
ncbi:hypothetical protein ACLB2K_011183 [Fragaria x ananassa]